MSTNRKIFMKKLNSKGFSAPHILLLLLTAGIIFGVGWYVFNMGEATDTSQTPSSSKVTSNGVRTKYENQGPAMEPTFSDGEIIYGVIKSASEVKRGDIIVFVPPSRNVERVVKRVVGLPGDTVVIENGNITVTTSNGETYNPSLSGAPTSQNIKAAVKTESFYVVGDNLGNSLDSRVESFGQVPFADLLAVIEP